MKKIQKLNKNAELKKNGSAFYYSHKVNERAMDLMRKDDQ
jgi:hypothetical protein